MQHPEDYDFFQAVRLLERQRKKDDNQTLVENFPVVPEVLSRRRRRNHSSPVVESKKIESTTLSFRPELSLDYAVSELVAVEEDELGNLHLTTSFQGLYGISSPLPAYYTEELLDDEWDGNNAPRDFLDIIHQHLYPLLYQAWQKYRFTHQTLEQGETKYWDILYSLMGLVDPEFRASSKYSQKLLPYLGILSQQQKSIVGLQTILRDVLNTSAVEIIPCVLRNTAIPNHQYCLLGEKQVTLGEDATIGQTVQDRMGKACIHINDVDGESFHYLLKSPETIELIRAITKFYLVQPLVVDVVLNIQRKSVRTVEIGGESWSTLGKDTWLQSGHDLVGSKEVISIVLC